MAAFSDKIWSWKQSSKPMNFETIIVTAISTVSLAKKIAATFLENLEKHTSLLNRESTLSRNETLEILYSRSSSFSKPTYTDLLRRDTSFILIGGL